MMLLANKILGLAFARQEVTRQKKRSFTSLESGQRPLRISYLWTTQLQLLQAAYSFHRRFGHETYALASQTQL